MGLFFKVPKIPFPSAILLLCKCLECVVTLFNLITILNFFLSFDSLLFSCLLWILARANVFMGAFLNQWKNALPQIFSIRQTQFQSYRPKSDATFAFFFFEGGDKCSHSGKFNIFSIFYDIPSSNTTHWAESVSHMWLKLLFFLAFFINWLNILQLILNLLYSLSSICTIQFYSIFIPSNC